MDLEILEAHPSGPASATPMLFVHGAWHGAWCWAEHMLRYVAERGFHAHALSFRGHGRSGNVTSLRRTSLGDYVSDLAETVSRLPAPPVIVAHSMGAIVTGKYLARGGKVPAIVLLAPVPLRSGVLGLTVRFALRHPLVLVHAIGTMRLWPVVANPALTREMLFGERLTAEEVAALHPKLQDESFLAYLGMLVPGVDPSRVTVPVLVLGGERDAVFTHREIHATARALGVEAELVPGAAHDLMLDPAWEEVAARIVEWLDELGLGAAAS